MLAIIFNTAVLTALWTIVLIFLLLLEELGVFRRVNKKVQENKKILKVISIFGDILYGIGISIVGSVFYAATGIGMGIFSYKLFLGISLIAVGAYIKK
jgi:hypothetical protein